MEQQDIAGIILKMCLLISLMAFGSSTAAAFKDQNVISNQGLYNASDDVVILNATNFRTSVYGSNRSWLVEFYNSWCGFCFRFAPTWKTLASDILSWNDIVVVAAIDCAADENNPICREYEIMHYPTLKFFSVNAHLPSLGIVIEKGDTIDSIRQNLVARLEMEQQEGRGATWPNIAPYRNVEITDIWKTASNSVKYFFLIFEQMDSTLGTEVILDLHKINTLQIRRVTSDNMLLCITNQVTKFPTLIAFGRNESQKVVNVRISARQGFRRAIKDYMIAKGVNISESGTTSRETHQSDVNTIAVATTGKTREEERQVTSRKKAEDYLYQLDLENALHYSINHEIPLSKTIEGVKMEALRRYLVVLATYFPLPRSNMYLDIIRSIVETKPHMTGEEFSQLAKTSEEGISPVYSKPRGWIGCKGSTNSYRGYPCGLWTMFHMLTVNFALENRDMSETRLQNDPAVALRAMHGYIKSFFGCADCAAHFVEMADRNRIFDVHSKDDSVLWLWRAHNEVNARLAGDKTEDPEHKKIQYPSAEHCADCRFANGSWNEELVLRYLKRKYSYNEIKYDGIENNDNTESMSNGNESKVRLERLATEVKRTSDEELNGFDISIWLVLYVMSFVIFTLVCSRELKSYKRRMWVQEESSKKKRIHLNLLTKV